MKQKGMILFLGLLGLVFLTSTAQAQRVELLLEDDQLLKSGRSALHAGNLERALFYYEKAIERKASISRIEMITVHNGLCVTYMYMERFEEALEQCQTSLELQPNRWETMNNLGTVYLVMGDYPQAILTYEKALKMKSGSRILLRNMEIAQQRMREARMPQEIGSDVDGFDKDNYLAGPVFGGNSGR